MAASQHAAIQYLPDLEAVGLTITATYANDKVNVSGLAENIGVADASGPFEIDIAGPTDNVANRLNRAELRGMGSSMPPVGYPPPQAYPPPAPPPQVYPPPGPPQGVPPQGYTNPPYGR